MDVDQKIKDTIEVFYDLQNLYAYEDDTRGVLRKMYDNTLEVLSNPHIDVTQVVDEKNNNLLHLAADANSVKFFIQAAKKGIDPYLKNNKNRNAFQSRHYEFANNLWKKFERVYFEKSITDKSFEVITQGFHVNFKQAIYENNIKNNKFNFNIKEISTFLKEQNIYSHDNVLLFVFEKFDGNLLDLLEFVVHNEKELTPENNSLALHCALKHLQFKNNLFEASYLLDIFMQDADFSLNEHFLQSMQISASNYKKSGFDSILHKQTKFLVNHGYNIKQKFDFYFHCHYKKGNKEIHSVGNLEELFKAYNLQSVYNYHHIDFKLKEKNDGTKNKRPKI